MKLHLLPLAAACLALGVSHSTAELPPANEGTLTLVEEPGYNEIDITLTVDLLGSHSDTDTSTFTGTMQARLDIDPDTGQSPEFTLLGGDIEGSPIALKISTLLGSIDVSSSTLGGTVSTIAPPGLIDPATGTGDAAQHEFIINRGTVSGTAMGNPISVDFSTNPAGGPGKGTETVDITSVRTDATRAYFQVTFVLPVQFEKPIPNDYGIDATLSGSGTIKATGEVSVPLSDYLAWTEQQGIPGVPASTPSKFGVTDAGLLWALGLGLSEDPRPHLPRPDPARPRSFVLDLPATGSRGPVFIESSTTLRPGSWTLVAPADLSAPSNPLPPGTTGTISITPAAQSARYLRIRSEP